MNEKFRGSFAEPFLPRSAGSGGRASTVAAVLVLVAGDTKVCGIEYDWRCGPTTLSLLKRLSL